MSEPRLIDFCSDLQRKFLVPTAHEVKSGKGGPWMPFVAGDGRVFLAWCESGIILDLSLAEEDKIDRVFQADGLIREICHSEALDRLFVLSESGMTAMDLVDGRQHLVPLPFGGNVMALHPKRPTLCVTDHVTNTLTVLNAETLEVNGVCRVGRRPSALAVSPTADDRLYVGHQSCTYVCVVDLNTVTSSDVLHTGWYPRELWTFADGGEDRLLCIRCRRGDVGSTSPCILDPASGQVLLELDDCASDGIQAFDEANGRLVYLDRARKDYFWRSLTSRGTDPSTLRVPQGRWRISAVDFARERLISVAPLQGVLSVTHDVFGSERAKEARRLHIVPRMNAMVYSSLEGVACLAHEDSPELLLFGVDTENNSAPERLATPHGGGLCRMAMDPGSGMLYALQTYQDSEETLRVHRFGVRDRQWLSPLEIRNEDESPIDRSEVTGLQVSSGILSLKTSDEAMTVDAESGVVRSRAERSRELRRLTFEGEGGRIVQLTAYSLRCYDAHGNRLHSLPIVDHEALHTEAERVNWTPVRNEGFALGQDGSVLVLVSRERDKKTEGEQRSRVEHSQTIMRFKIKEADGRILETGDEREVPYALHPRRMLVDNGRVFYTDSDRLLILDSQSLERVSEYAAEARILDVAVDAARAKIVMLLENAKLCVLDLP